MKTLRIGFGTLLVLTIVTSVAMAQRGPGNGAGQARGAGGPGTQTRGGHQGQTGQPQRGNKGRSGESGNPNQQSPGVLSTDTLGLDLLRMREEEQLARDVYTSLAKTSMLTVFGSISRAEAREHVRKIPERRWFYRSANAFYMMLGGEYRHSGETEAATFEHKKIDWQ